MNNFLKKNTVALLALIVAIIGGVPGVIAIISHSERKPQLIAHMVNCAFGSKTPDFDSPGLSAFITITLSNSGGKPLTPSYFTLDCYINDKWVKFDKQFIPYEPSFYSDLQEIHIMDPQKKDLQLYDTPIQFVEPVHGFLWFTNEELFLTQIREVEEVILKITCVDILNNKYDIFVTQETGAKAETIEHPKHGLFAYPTTE